MINNILHSINFLPHVFLAEMSVGLMYSIVAFLGSLIIGIILERTLSTKYRETIDPRFIVLLGFFIAFTLVDGTWGLFFSEIIHNELGYKILTYGFHTMSAFSAFVWMGYMISYTKIHKVYAYLGNIYRFVALIVEMALLTANIWNGKVFTIIDFTYETYNLRTLLFWIQFSHYGIIAIFAIFFWLQEYFKAKYNNNNNNNNNNRFKNAIIYGLVPLVAGVFQLLFPDAPMYSMGFILTALIVYAFNTSSFREQYMEQKAIQERNALRSMVMALSSDYKFVCIVNTETERFVPYGTTTILDELLKENPIEKIRFFKDFLPFAQLYIDKTDFELIKIYFNKENLLNTIKNQSTITFSFRFTRRNVLNFYSVKITRADDEKIVIGIYDDSTRIIEEKRQQSILEDARKKAEEASEAKSRFLFNMSHDIRTPLNAIIGFSNLARKYEDDFEKRNECLSKVESSSSHLLSLVNDILDMSRIESGKTTLNIQETSFNKIMTSILTMIKPMAEDKNINIKVEIDKNAYDSIRVDEQALTRILINILTNAVKYTNGGGTVEFINTYNEIDQEKGLYKFIIKDNGIGMSKEFQEHIFETFARERTSTVSGIQGTGLGMAITKSLVDLMNGNITVESEENIGTTIEISLPLELYKNVVEETQEGNDNISSDMFLQDKYILLVEDNPLNREIACDILGDFGAVIDEADDGSVAVSKIKEIINDSTQKQYDFILMDIQMPTMDGYTATKEIRNLDDDYARNVPIIAMTANVFPEDVMKSIECGMQAHIGKPIDINTLVNTLKKIIK